MQHGPIATFVKFGSFQIWTKFKGVIRRPVAYMQLIQAADKRKGIAIYPTNLLHVRETVIPNNPCNKPTLFEKPSDMSY